MAKQHLTEGMKVKILEEEKGEVIDVAIIRRVGTDEHQSIDEIEIESLVHPGEMTEFTLIRHRDSDKEGWHMLFEDPVTGGRCFSQEGPAYTFEPA